MLMALAVQVQSRMAALPVRSRAVALDIGGRRLMHSIPASPRAAARGTRGRRLMHSIPVGPRAVALGTRGRRLMRSIPVRSRAVALGVGGHILMIAHLASHTAALDAVTSVLDTTTPAALPETGSQRLVQIAVANFRTPRRVTDDARLRVGLVEQVFECSTNCSTCLVNVARARQERLHQARSLSQTIWILSMRWLELTVSSWTTVQ